MLENKDFWDQFLKSSDESPGSVGKTTADTALLPEYRTEDGSTTDSPGELSFDIESILADIRKMTDGRDRSLASVRQAPSVDEPPAEKSDEKQLMREMLSTMQELTEEVKQLRAQLESPPYDTARYLSERPPGIAVGEENADGSVPEPTPDTQSEPKKPEKNNKALSIISNVLFYVVVVAMVLGAFLMRSTSKGEPFMLAGFSAANVLTSSMSDVYPQGSLIITKQVEAKELKIGDDITFMVSEDSSITHRIIGITENYQGTGARAFQTQGTKNPNPDKEMVAAANVVGKVIFHSKALGDFANFARENWPILIFVLIVIIALISFLKWNAKKSDEDDDEQKGEPKGKKSRSHTKKAK